MDSKTIVFGFVANLEPFDPLLDGVDVGAELKALQLAQLSLGLTQPGPHGLQV